MSETKLLLPEKTSDLSPIQRGWLQMCGIREKTFADLEKAELEIQGLLTGHQTITDLPDIQERLKKAKGIFEESKEQRLAFTNTLKEKIIEPAMQFENRSDRLIKDAGQSEFQLRKAKEKENEAANNKLKEKQLLEAHIKNEWHRIAVEHRLTLQKRITFYYKGALQQNRMNAKNLAVYLQDIKNELPQIELGKFNRFPLVLVSAEEAKAIMQGIPAYNPAEDLAHFVAKVDEDFAMYDSDMKNAEAALKTAEEAEEQLTSSANENIAMESSTNNLIASADSMEFASGPKVKRKIVIVEENTESWAMAVLGHFIKNKEAIKKHILVKTWAKLSIGQMANALSKWVNEQQVQSLTGLTFKTEEK